jgi:hypothetical protein
LVIQSRYAVRSRTQTAKKWSQGGVPGSCGVLRTRTPYAPKRSVALWSTIVNRLDNCHLIGQLSAASLVDSAGKSRRRRERRGGDMRRFVPVACAPLPDPFCERIGPQLVSHAQVGGATRLRRHAAGRGHHRQKPGPTRALPDCKRIAGRSEIPALCGRNSRSSLTTDVALWLSL